MMLSSPKKFITQYSPKLFFLAPLLFMLVVLNLGNLAFLKNTPAAAPTALAAYTNPADEAADKDMYEKYEQCDKRDKYLKYKEYKEKYGFSSTEERLTAKEHYRLYKSNKKKYAKYYNDYKKYKNYKNKYLEYRNYGKYSKYNKKEYKKYCTDTYEEAHDRYELFLKEQEDKIPNVGNLGPEMTVGILSKTSSELKSSTINLMASKNLIAKNKAGAKVADIPKSTEIKVSYDGSGILRAKGGGIDKTFDEYIYFEAADGNNGDLLFDVEPKTFDTYRGKITIHYVADSKDVWVINALPLEQYVWGMGEITGTGDAEYNKVMTIVFRTYGYWKMLYSTKYEKEGFKVDTTAGNQIYYGYDWETGHPRIKEAAIATRSLMVRYKGDIAITPYSSSTDGRTRSWEERWGSKNYPYCQSVPDPWGKVDGAGSIEGNHMVGLSARGALKSAGDHGWKFDRILKYYYQGITIDSLY